MASPAFRAPPDLLWLCGFAVALTAGVVAFTLGEATPSERTAATLVNGLLVAVPMGVALAILRGAPRDRFSRLLFASGAAFSLTALSQSSDSVLYSVGRVSVWLVEPAVILLMLAFPSSRLVLRRDRRLAAGVVAMVALLYLPTAFLADSYPLPSPWTSCGEHCPANAFAFADLGIADVLRPIREVLTVLVVGAVAWSLARRINDARPLLRRALQPVLAIALFQVFAYASYQWGRRGGAVSPHLELVGRIWVLSLPAIAISFAVGLLRRRLQVASVMRHLTLNLRAPATAFALRTQLADALEDPSLRVVYWLPGQPGRWVDESGWPATIDVEAPGVVTEVTAEGRRVAAVLHDGTLAPDATLIEAGASYGMVVLEHTQLIAELAASIRQLTEAEERTVAVAAHERRKIERDLHDGAQQHLLALRIRLALLAERLHDATPGAASEVEAIGDELGETIEGVRTLARGSYPLMLAQHGLVPSLRLVAIDSTLPASVRATRVGRYSEQVEATVYFSCVEALQNAVKHARGATGVTIVLVDDGSLRFEVTDDGHGFDNRTSEVGAGLRNISDRVASVGGTLLVDSVPGRGTHVTGVIPVG
jgi:signal transduction histidine kinase